MYQYDQNGNKVQVNTSSSSSPSSSSADKDVYEGYGPRGYVRENFSMSKDKKWIIFGVVVVILIVVLLVVVWYLHKEKVPSASTTMSGFGMGHRKTPYKWGFRFY